MRGHPKAPSARSIGGHHRFGLTLFASLALALMCGLLATSVQAATVYRGTGTIFATPSEPTPVVPSGAAVEESTGRFFTANVLEPAVVEIFAPEGGSTRRIGTIGAHNELAFPRYIALDQASGSVYVVDGGLGQIVKFDRTSVEPPTYVRDSSFQSPAAGAEPGQIANFFTAPIAVDPTTGDLLVADQGANRVSRFSSDGTYLSSFDGAGAPAGAFHKLSSLAVAGGGDIYVVDIVEGGINYESEHGRSVVERFAADGTADPSFHPDLPTPRTVTYDDAAENVVVTGRSDRGLKEPLGLFVIHDGEVIDEESFPVGSGGGVSSGLAISPTGPFRLYATTFPENGGYSGVTVFEAHQAPDVTIGPLANIGPTSVELSGAVDPLGHATRYHFAYSREGGPTQDTESVSVGEGEGAESVSGELTDLIPNSEYEVRLVGTVEATGVNSYSRFRSFTTPPAPPKAITGEALDLTQTGATLQGTTNPYGQPTSYRFEYGPTSAYGTTSPADHEDVAGNGREDEGVHAYLIGLQPGTEYHYRLVATNGSGTTVSADRTFVTRSSAAAPRVYEQVSPVEKGGSNVEGTIGFTISPDGNRIMYQWKTAPSGAESAPAFPRTASTRTPSGWTYRPLDPPQVPGSAAIAHNIRLVYVLGVSEDGSEAFVDSLKALAPGATEGGSNFYLRNAATGEYTTIASTPGGLNYGSGSYLGGQPVVDGTPDYSHVLVVPWFEPFEPGGPEGGLYDFSDGQLGLVSIAPDGTPMSNVDTEGSSSVQPRDKNWISDDGSKVFFQSVVKETYIRYLGQEETVKVGGRFCGAGRDGKYGFVIGSELTPDSEAGVASLYRFDSQTRETELLGPAGSLESCLQVSSNGRSVFLQSDGHVSVWHDGRIDLVADPTRPGEYSTAPSEYMASDNGRYFIFVSYASLTGYDNSSQTACVDYNDGDPGPGPNGGIACREIFRYDIETQQVTCASCRRDGGPPTGRPHFGWNQVEGDLHYARSILNDGTVIFDTPDPLVALDTNSNRDVYTFDGTEDTLISSGFENSRSEFDGASADGKDIFFTTQDQLVGQDKDSLADIYDARIGGGIPGQNPLPPRGECIRDDCKATPSGGPELPFGGSEALSGPGNVSAAARKRCAKGTHARKVKGKPRCVKQVKKKQSKQSKKAKSNRRQAR